MNTISLKENNLSFLKQKLNVQAQKQTVSVKYRGSRYWFNHFGVPVCCSYLQWSPGSSGCLHSVLPPSDTPSAPAFPGECNSLSSARFVLPSLWTAAAPPPPPSFSLFHSGAEAVQPAWLILQERATSFFLLSDHLHLLSGARYSTHGNPDSPGICWPDRLGGEGADTCQSWEWGARPGLVLWLNGCLQRGQWTEFQLSVRRRMTMKGTAQTESLYHFEAMWEEGRRFRQRSVSVFHRTRGKERKAKCKHRQNGESGAD